MNEQNEFKIAGLTIPVVTIGYGVFLVLWGAAFSIGSKSFTSWIPSMMGAPILVSGLLAKVKPDQKKLWMHVAVVFGLLCFLGGLRVLKGIGSEEGMFGNVKAASSQLMLVITGGVYTFACVRSFIWARKQRENEVGGAEAS